MTSLTRPFGNQLVARPVRIEDHEDLMFTRITHSYIYVNLFQNGQQIPFNETLN